MSLRACSSDGPSNRKNRSENRGKPGFSQLLTGLFLNSRAASSRQPRHRILPLAASRKRVFLYDGGPEETRSANVYELTFPYFLCPN